MRPQSQVSQKHDQYILKKEDTIFYTTFGEVYIYQFTHGLQ